MSRAVFDLGPAPAQPDDLRPVEPDAALRAWAERVSRPVTPPALAIVPAEAEAA